MAPDTDLTERFCKLSPGQLDVLREVAQYKTSKEIARLLAISPHTVDKRIARIMAILGVASRADAARLYIVVQGGGEIAVAPLYEHLVYQSSSLPLDDFAAYGGPSANERNPVDDGAMHALREAQAQYFAESFHQPQDRSWLSVLSRAGQSNELTAGQRTIAIFVIMILAIMTLSILVSLVEGLSRVV